VADSPILPDRNASPPTAVGFGEALRFWFRLGLISFGGPAGQIAILHAELVERRRWISERRFFHALNYCMLLPGPEAQQLATYIGWLLHRTAGGIAAGSLFVLPSLVLLVVLSWLYVAFGHMPLLTGVFYGIKPAVIAIVAHAAYRIGRRALGNAWLGAIAAGAFVATFALNLPFPLIVLVAALAGWIGGRLAPERFRAANAHPAMTGARGQALIDDDSPTPAHARFDRARLATVMVAGLALWVGPVTALAAWGGLHGTYAQMAWFFTKAALLTFGGAYAVLPYVYQGAVTGYGWLTAWRWGRRHPVR
jgi:chromate transporter